jgi:hypothetical protein
MESIDLEPAFSGEILAVRGGLRRAVAAYLARYKAQSRMHTDSDLRGFLDWCQERVRCDRQDGVCRVCRGIPITKATMVRFRVAAGDRRSGVSFQPDCVDAQASITADHELSGSAGAPAY